MIRSAKIPEDLNEDGQKTANEMKRRFISLQEWIEGRTARSAGTQVARANLEHACHFYLQQLGKENRYQR